MNHHFYQKYPRLLNLSLQDFSKKFVEKLDASIALSLKELGVPPVMIQPAMIEKLQENLILWQTFRKTLFFPLLLKALEDQHPDVRHQVCETLSKLPLTAEDRAVVLPALIKALADENAEVRNCSAQALSNLLLLTPEDIATVLPVLLQELKSNVMLIHLEREGTGAFNGIDVFLVNGVCEVLAKLSLPAESINAVLHTLLSLLFALGDQHVDIRSQALRALSKLPLTAKNVVTVLPFLLKTLENDESDVRRHVCEALSKLSLIEEDRIVVLSALTKAVEDKNEDVRNSAEQALLNLSFRRENALTVLPDSKTLADKDLSVTSSTEEVPSRLLLTTEYKTNRLPGLLKALGTENGTVRSNAVEVLLNLPLTAEDKILVVLPTLLQLLEDKSLEIRIQTVGLLVEFYPSAHELVEACCQKFKKAGIALPLSQETHATTHQIAVVKSGIIYQENAVNFHAQQWTVGQNSRNQHMNVSGQGNNCGLFALILGVKNALDNKPWLRDKTKLPDFFDSLDITWLRPDSDAKETVEIGIKLRQEMNMALLKDLQYKARRYHNFITCCREFLEDKPVARDMEAWLKVTQAYRENLKKRWVDINDSLEESYNAYEAYYRNLLSDNILKSDDIQKLKEQLSKQVFDKPEEKVLNELLESYYPSEENLILRLIKLRRLCRVAWVNVTSGTGLERNFILDCVEDIFKKKTLSILQKQHSSEVHENLLLLSLLEKTNFDKGGTLVSNSIMSREEVLSTAAALFVENNLIHDWNNIYQNYAEHIKTTTEMLSADELGCLARYWQVGLKIQFVHDEPYTTGQVGDLTQLQVVLCNPSQMHWNVVCDNAQPDVKEDSSKIIALISGLENIEYKLGIIDAINNEVAYAQRAEDCSYIVGVASSIQDIPQILAEQGNFLSKVDLNAAKMLSQHFEQGLLKLNAEQIYCLKSSLNMPVASNDAALSATQELTEFQNSLLLDFNNTRGRAAATLMSATSSRGMTKGALNRR